MTWTGSRIAHGYKAKLDAYGGVRGALRTFSPLELIDSGLRETWLRVGSLVWRLLPGRKRMKYGILEALLFPLYDQWLRYEKVVDAIREANLQGPLRILEVGCGTSGIVLFLKPGAARVCLTDQTNANVIPFHCAAAQYVRADACRLPFADSSFPVVISVDTLEHIPRAARAAFFSELKRVASEMVLLVCPLDSRDGSFQAPACDEQLRCDLRRAGRRVPQWVEEHLGWGHPTVEEVTEMFPGARIEGWQNCRTWMRFQPLFRRPFCWFFAGVSFVLSAKKTDDVPPYYRGLCVWRKEPVASRATCSSSEMDAGVLSPPLG